MNSNMRAAEDTKALYLEMSLMFKYTSFALETPAPLSAELLRTKSTFPLSDKSADILTCTNAPLQRRGGNKLEASLLSQHCFHSGTV